jgi:alpha-2-macroglobulin
MRNIFGKILLTLVVCFGTVDVQPALALPAQEAPPTQLVQDYSTEAELLKVRALRASAELAILREKSKARGQMTLEELLTYPNNPDDLSQFAQQNEIFIKLALTIGDPDSWYLAAGQFQDAKQFSEARFAAWYAYKHSVEKRSQLAALDKLTDAHMGYGDITAAITVLEFTLSIDPAPHRMRRLRGIKARYMLRIVNVTVDTEAHTPTACLTFSAALKSPLPIKAADYVRFEKPVDVRVTARDKSICIAGFDFGTSNPVTILKGLPGATLGALYNDVTRTLVIPNRKPRVLLGNGTYILPRVGGEAIPVKTVNLSSVALKLYSVPDRGLVPILRSGMDLRQLANYREQQIESEFGRLVWQGSVEVANKANQEITTLVRVSDLIEKYQPGLYALVARTPEKAAKNNSGYWAQNATQWLLVSDLGLMTLSGSDGLHIYVNSLETAKPVRKTKLQLVARNNGILAEAETDTKGIAVFPAALMRGKGGDRPAVIVAHSATGDYSFLKLSGPALDLSDRGASGRRQSGPLDAFLFTERGIYRPGEQVYIAGLLRDAKAKAAGNLPLTFLIRRPDGVEAFKETINGDDLGGYQLDYKLSASARTGHWYVSVYTDRPSKIIGATKFQVDDFVPERLTAKTSVGADILHPGEKLEVRVQADFLYGAPGSELKGSLHLLLEPDPAPFKNYKGYRFGLEQDEFRLERLDEQLFTTGTDGLARIDVLVKTLPDTSRPLRARLTAEVNDIGGRPVTDSLLVPVRAKSVLIGIKARSGGAFGESEAAEFDLVTLDGNGQIRGNHTLKAIWIREHYNYSWYNSGGRWKYRSDTYDEVISEAAIETKADGSLALLRALGPGRYRLELHDEEADATTSVRFNVGWWTSGASPDEPDALELTLDDNRALSGGTLKGFVKAPFSGTAMITAVNDRLLSHKVISLAKEGSAFEIAIGKNWGPSAYILVTALRPHAGALTRLPVRATGLAWFSIDRKKHLHKLTLDVPDTVLPSKTVKIPVKLSGGKATGKHRLVIAAVDEGILNITRFKPPNPAKHYFGKRYFAMDIRDIYGRLIRAEKGATGILRTGGDKMDLAFEEVMVSASRVAGSNDNLASPITRTTKTVAMFVRDVQLDKNGEGMLSLDIPDFSGRLRLMAVAYGANSIGQGQAQLTVRTPVVADLVLPRFLAPGDTAHAVLSLQNLSGKATRVKISFEKDGDFIGLKSAVNSVTLKDGERRDLPVIISGVLPGITKINLDVTGRNIEPISRTWSISVRAAWPFTTTRQMNAVAAGENTVLSASAISSFVPGTVTQRITVSSRPNLEAMRSITSLQHYAYWCSEQTVSKAYPALQYNRLSKIYDLPIDKNAAANTVESAIARLVDRQKPNGRFGLWSWSGRSYAWLDIYITDFLIRANKAGYHVADATLELALANIKRHSTANSKAENHISAYAFYVLARLGEVSASQVRYFADQNSDHIDTPLGIAHLGAALHLVGERTLGTRYLEVALKKPRPSRYMRDYGSALRDKAAIAALIAEVLPDATYMAALAEALENSIGENTWLSTQELSWVTRAAAAFAGDGDGGMAFRIGNRAITSDSGLWEANISGAKAIQNVEISNEGNGSLRAIRAIRGIPVSAPDPASNGMAITRTYYTLNGNQVIPKALKQNDRLVVVLELEVTANAVHDPLIVDLLPAGLEVESTDTSSLSFVGAQTRAEFVDARDDRLVAAFEWNRRNRHGGTKIRVAYIVRAITPGTYILPGTFAEDMYQPRYRAQGAAGRVTVEK